MSTHGMAVRFCERLGAVRRKRGYTQEQLARLAEVSIGTVRDLEQGRRMPWMTTAVALARALGTTVEQLTGERSNEH